MRAICEKDVTVYFGMIDALLAAEQLPEEYRDRCQDILCNDCGKKGTSRFHWLYHKCGFCVRPLISFDPRKMEDEGCASFHSGNFDKQDEFKYQRVYLDMVELGFVVDLVTHYVVIEASNADILRSLCDLELSVEPKSGLQLRGRRNANRRIH
ncbi:hypothetical protein OPV22_012516 [Ensete ventricosum]|uniref:RCHY1 zinc-ribbon domain-containing protein n=1 Tax=Ensete ventricosum TaxID=4639 RepID=A0AAV8R6C0_ENSVE|nr:hypothetical protein OPV22_012516 [Ensete ventricosum]